MLLQFSGEFGDPKIEICVLKIELKSKASPKDTREKSREVFYYLGRCMRVNG